MKTENLEPSIIAPSRTFFSTLRCVNLDNLDAHVGFLGVPYDGGTNAPWARTGQSKGPNAIRDTNLTLWFNIADIGLFDIDKEKNFLQGVKMADCGDVNVTGAASELNINRITTAANQILDKGALLVGVGGDHSITYPLVRAYNGRFDSIDIIQFDAHFDYMDNINGSEISHGSTARRLSELPFVQNISYIGVRTTTAAEYNAIKQTDWAKWATPKQVINEGIPAVIDRLVEPNRNVYVTIDIDGMDGQAQVLGTTKPEPGGLMYEHYRHALELIAERCHVIGFDIVENSPPNDPSGGTAQLSAWLMARFLGYIFDNKD